MAIQYFLDRFYMSRISMRMLIHQHTLLFEPDADHNTNRCNIVSAMPFQLLYFRIGVIDPACKLKSMIMEAFQNAAFLCEEYYNCAPDIEIKGKIILRYKSKRDTQMLHTTGQTMTRNEKGKKVGLSLVYPPPHLYHILFELFKNSMRATVETHSKAKELPEIEVLLAKGEHDVSIRISDQVYFQGQYDFKTNQVVFREVAFPGTSQTTLFTI